MDPLRLVRQATVSNTPVKYVDGCYIFGTHKIPETTKTCFKRSLSGKHGSGGGYYSIRDIIFFLENEALSIAEYRRKAQEANITAVVVNDKDNLKKYLTGEIDDCEQLDHSQLEREADAQVHLKSLNVQSLASTSVENATVSDEWLVEKRRKYSTLFDDIVKPRAAIPIENDR